tara:strand:- start:269 stop:622 length:354 start_codon:yes stop_codon:yes gene_type:complete
LATIKVHEQANVWSVPLFGEVVSRNNAINASVMQALSRAGDRNLMVSFDESDREALEAIEGKQLEMISIELGQPVTSNKDLLDLLLPKPVVKVEPKKSILPKVKKVAPKVKKSELSE